MAHFDKAEYVYLSQGHNQMNSLRHYLGIPFIDEYKMGMRDWVGVYVSVLNCTLNLKKGVEITFEYEMDHPKCGSNNPKCPSSLNATLPNNPTLDRLYLILQTYRENIDGNSGRLIIDCPGHNAKCGSFSNPKFLFYGTCDGTFADTLKYGCF